MDDYTKRRLCIYSGLAAPIVAFATILIAGALDPGFDWLDSALSDTGKLPDGERVSASLLSEQPSFFVFNGGLILTGLIGLPFAWLLYEDGQNVVHTVGAALFALGLLTLAAVGWFYLPKSGHGTAAVAHFGTSTLFLLVYGTGFLLAGRRRFGLGTITVAVAEIAFWILWGVWLIEGPMPGIAIPELVGAVAFGGWAFTVALWKYEALGAPDQ